MDFSHELSLLGVGQVRFMLRQKVKAEWLALTIGLWRLALERSFPNDGETIFDVFIKRRLSGLSPKKAAAFAGRVYAYVDSLKAHGDADFMPTGERLLGLIHSQGAEAPALRLRVALHIRNLYTLIFNRLI